MREGVRGFSICLRQGSSFLLTGPHTDVANMRRRYTDRNDIDAAVSFCLRWVSVMLWSLVKTDLIAGWGVHAVFMFIAKKIAEMELWKKTPPDQVAKTK